MQIKVQTGTLKRTKWHECVIRFFLGGAVTVVAAMVAKEFGPAAGGLFLAFPAIFPASATLVEKHEREMKEQQGLHRQECGRAAAALDAAGAVLGSLGLLAFAAFVWLLLPDHSPWVVLIAAGMLWFATSCCLWWVREHRHRIFGVPNRMSGPSGHRVK